MAFRYSKRVKRYSRFKEVVDQDVCGRAKYVLKEIEFVLQREQLAGQLQVRRETGELPVRVTHNDTKLNNVLLDEKTRKALCVIDLDTVMPGLAAYDFGDSIRFGATTAAEDEQDLNKVTIDVELFRIYTRGYLESFPEFTDAEIDSLPLGALIMTLECGVRFLTDYLEGDRYFAIHREHHNLDRARTQFHLVSEMEKKFDEMCRIVKEEANVIRGESMERYGIEVKVKNRPKLDDSFIPIQLFNQSFLKTAKKPVSIAIERTNGDIAAANTFIHG